ncbi:MAG TPA: uridine kinase, partial [Syntrophomonas wolfei]|nr:uridine kinase [Syntrophomonas wolfei]
IPRIGAQELLNKDLEDLVVERAVLEMLVRSQSVKEIQIINGLKEGNLSRALNGEHIGTIIYKDI